MSEWQMKYMLKKMILPVNNKCPILAVSRC